MPVVVDASIGVPSQALEALEMGADAVLVNTAIAVAQDPVAMARALRVALEAGDVERALAADNPGPEEMMALLSPAALAYLERWPSGRSG